MTPSPPPPPEDSVLAIVAYVLGVIVLFVVVGVALELLGVW